MSYTIEHSVLKFDDDFNEPLDDYMEIMSNPNINEIYFGEIFNQEIDHKIPFNIKIIRFHGNSIFNKDVNFLPESIKELYYGCDKNHSSEELKNLPRKLTYLQLGDDFDQEIKENVLPENLISLTFGCDYDQKINKNILPNSLTHLTFCCSFNQEIKPGVLPKNLTSLTLGEDFDQEIKPGVLPKSLTHLTFSCYFNQEIKPGVLPDNLNFLIFGWCFNHEINSDVLPKSLKVLKLYNNDKYKDTILKNIDLSKVSFEIKYYKN